MPKKDLVEIVAIVDRSGSMGPIADDAIGGFNVFLQEQKECPGEANFTLILFNDEYKIIEDGTPINNVGGLTRISYSPCGCTAMNDAIGKAIDTVGKRLAQTEECDRPAKVIVAILTDGQENSSIEYSSKQIAEMIKTQTEQFSWEFHYLAANQDAFAAASALNISNSMNFAANGAGVRSAYISYSTSVSKSRIDSDN